MLNEALSTMPDVFEAKILLRGQEYFEKGHVLNIRFSDGLLKGRVKGSASQIYDVHMDLKAWPKKSAHCTCAYQSNCKHAAACLLALRDREKNNSKSLPANKLDKKLDIWLKNLRAQEAATIKTQEATHHLVYLIDLKFEGHEHRVVIKLALAKLLKRGGYGKMITFNSLSDSKKQHFIGDDNDLVALLLFKCGVSGWFDSLNIRNSELLERIISTGRAFFIQNPNKAIQLGESIRGTCQWVLSHNGSQNLVLMHEDNAFKPLLLDNSWYFNYSEAKIGCLLTSYPIKQLSYLLEAPSIPLDQAELLANKMAHTCPEFPVPQVFKQREVREVLPVPVLVLDTISEFDEESSWLYDTDEELHALFTVHVVFDYAGLIITASDQCDTVVRQQEGVLIQYVRDKDFEKLKWDEVQSLLDLRVPRTWEYEQWGKAKKVDFIIQNINVLADLEFLRSQSIPDLKEKGWRVECVGTLYQEVVNADEVEWYSDLQESTTDFFSYQLGILVEGKQVSIVPLIADLIQRYSANSLDNLSDDQLVKLPLQDGRALQLEMGRIKPLIRLLLQFGLRHFDAHQSVSLSKYQLILMREAELAIAALKTRWQGAETLREQIRQLTLLTNIPEIQAPLGLQVRLRDYQRYGFSWLQFLRISHFNGILADDMGLGKTVQTLAHLLYEKEQGRTQSATLIVAPTSLVGNWLVEAKRFTPQLNVLIHHGAERHQDNFDDYDLVISTYGLIQRDKEKFVSYPFYYLILDEAQFIKNARTKTTQIIQQLHATHRLCLTGTPLENHLGELWSLFHFLMPGLLGDAKQFRLWFRTPIEKYADRERREILIKRVQPFILRRTKNQVARELPPKTEMTHTIELIGAQRDLYEAIRMSMEKKVRDAIAKQGLGKSHILLLDALLKLRQVCCDPRLLSLPEAAIAHGTSAKLEALMDLLNNLIGEGRRVLVFSQFTSMLQLIEEELRARHYDYLKLTGQTQHRQAMVDKFQEGNTPVFLISLKAGGTGLNLTRADTVIQYDPWWNPAVEAQATDRAHRIGQENPVFVYKLITAGTVEEAILTMQEKKRLLGESVLSPDSTKATALSENDIEQFFMPLS
ncbi:DEAD/DEAH box helicase [Legionella longbeachae]|uniref:Putative DNA/RNA helicases, superfamily II, SNF2 family n=1 Tax=Legionella longbeachae serogroup 1 (strain NSW150) TaxID=661367 RepID=D3HQK8_LEGLN|nr:DEAD/DEAH box helicase [Legionella longbeachae]VEE01695.1 DNA/RNA helicase SNF2 [Legionella oakridgensis]HBD7396453.1 DEAD/DEAH box helicase [Legionella pneumophila]ARB91970.1 helicase [Legionella longbeachae]ARM34845.1 DEAD/DEAH box helicase [Legionella longbeachae]EEZ95709.1 SNF2/RAD54 family DNA helicase [Legionella longbeachae D-4968]